MKRSRDDVFYTSEMKRPVISSRAEPSGQPQMSTASSAQRLTTSDAMTYLKNVREIFQDKSHQYEHFLEVMKDFKSQRINTTGVILRVKEIFKGYRDLILGFNTFLPKGFEITLPPEDESIMVKKPVDFDEAIGFVSKIKARFHGDDHVYKAFLDILNMYKKDNKSITEVYQEVSVLFQDHADLLVEFTHFLPNVSGAASVYYAQPSKNHIVGRDDRGSPMTMAGPINVEKKHAVRDQYVDHPDREKGKEEYRDNEWEDDDSLEYKRKSSRKDNVTNQFYQEMQEPYSALLNKVKDRLQDPENYQKFLDCLRSYESKFVTTPQIRKLVGSLLGTHPDLMEEFEDFITYVEKTEFLRSNKQTSRSLKAEHQDGDDHDREDRDKNRDRENREHDRYDRGLTFKDVPGQKFPSNACKEKFMAKPIQELDLSNCESCTPSYRLLPDNYPIQSASRRTDIGAKVLNDHWVSVTSGSEDYSFKHMRKNQYEESLFRCEDDRFELDMLLESVNATTKRVEELLDSIDVHINKTDSSFHIEDHLTALNLRCIERLYGDHGLDVMDVLRKNAPPALPVILTRLKQKQEEWARCRADFNKVWAEIYAKNYHKSLDHRSFYFKQQDTKNLSAKALVGEIKEISERNDREEETVLSVGAGYRQPIRPDMEFKYPDPEIQKDLYQLIQYACGEVCTPEQSDKVMKIWETFLEKVLDVPSHPPSGEDVEDLTANDLIDKPVATIGEGNGSSAGEAASGSHKPSDVSKGDDEDITTEQFCSSRMSIENVNNGVNHDSSPNADNVTHKSDICRASLNGAMQTAVHIMSSMSGVNKQAGFLTRGTVNAAGGTSMSEKNAGLAGAHGDCGIGAINIKELLDGVKNLKEVTETSSKNEREGYAGVEAMPIEKTEEDTDANANGEGDGSTQVSSESENVSENGNVSGSESADASPEEPDEDVDLYENEGEADGTGDVHDNEGVMPSSDCSLENLNPLNMKILTTLYGKTKNSQIFYGNDSFYLLFRLHQMLYERMQSAKVHSLSPENKWRVLNDANPTDPYARFKEALHSLLNGSSDSAKFEDDCRAIIGAQSYILFTLDKLIHKLLKQLQTIASEEVDNRLLQLYAYERSRNPDKFADAVYYENARFLVPEDNLFRIECLPCPVRLTIQLMKNELDKHEVTPVSVDPNFSAYLNNELLSVTHRKRGKLGVFMKRNKSIYSTGDEVSDTARAMEGLETYNGLEIKISSTTFKAAYVLDTEDVLYRPKRRRKQLYRTSYSNGGSSNGASNGTSNGTSNGRLRRVRHRRLMFC